MSIAEKQFINYIKKFDDKPFKIIINNNEHMIGKGTPTFSVRVNKAPTLPQLLKSTSIALGEAYMNGDIEINGDLYTALCSFLSGIDKFSYNKTLIKKIIFPSSSKESQKQQVSAHYDIGNDFYKLWLDKTMSYSCGYFKSDEDTLETAQYNKVHRILKKLWLKEGMTLCDIGCGWGFLLIEAAKLYGIHGMGITLSREQKNIFEETIQREHLEDLVEVRLMDYRDLPKLNKKFDRVVSVGMVEHVGRANYSIFMSDVKKILKPGGLFLLHFISSRQEYPGDPWLKKYIFPGGVIPSLREIIFLAGDLNLSVTDAESLRRHYNKTLLCWNEAFQAHRSEITQMFNEKFARMWELYLCACAAAFINGVVDLHQILFTNNVNNSVPTVRWY